MSEKGPIILLATAVAVGITAGAFYWNAIKPTKEQSEQLLISSTIRSEVCKKIQGEVDLYKQSPDTFKRGTLRNIKNEATQNAKVELPQFPAERQIQYIDRKSIISNCEGLAQGWVKIPSTFPEFYEAELQELGLTTAQTNPSQPILANTDTAQKRIALVIGNSTYISKPLKNPVNDADDMTAFLKGAGFKVIEIKNADIFQLRSSIKNFEENLSAYDVGLIYYSGHGIEFKGSNYLIPVDAQLRNEQDIPRQGYDISSILAKMSKANKKTTIFILDACRNNPVFSQYRSAADGLTQMAAPSGAIIAFSAAPGQVASDGNGRNSPYTAALLTKARVPNKKIEDILKETSQKVSDDTGGRQIPWYNSSLVGDFYFSK
jgi:Caspase domain